MCNLHYINAQDAPQGGYSAILDIIQRIFFGLLGPGAVDQGLYTWLAETLFKATEEGFGAKLVDLDLNSPDYVLLKKMRDSIYVFSGAKTYQELRAMTALLFDEKGNLVGWNEFKRAALSLHQDYDVRFLAAEYNHAIASAQMARRWQDIQANKDLFPYLEYVTAGDERVRREHAAIDGTLLPVDDPFWRRYYPPNGWGCRCDVQSRDEGKVTDKTKLELPEVDEMFLNNVGITGTVFPKKHPYFNVAAADRERLNNNFGLPLPD